MNLQKFNIKEVEGLPKTEKNGKCGQQDKKFWKSLIDCVNLMENFIRTLYIVNEDFKKIHLVTNYQHIIYKNLQMFKMW